MCCGLGNILIVESHLQQSYPPPPACFWLSGSAARGGGDGHVNARAQAQLLVQQSPRSPGFSAFPQEVCEHKLGPVCFIQGNWSWVSAGIWEEWGEERSGSV